MASVSCKPNVALQRSSARKSAASFGVNLILHFPVEDHVAVCLEERVPILSLFWGDPTAHVERAHAAGVKVVHQVSTGSPTGGGRWR